MIVWKQIPAKEAEVRTRIILEIVAGELRRQMDEKQQRKVEAGQSAAATKSTEGTAMMIS